MQVILMTSDNAYHCLPPFYHLFEKYFTSPWRQKCAPEPLKLVTCGFSQPKQYIPPDWRFYSIGAFSDYPANRWSDAFIKVLDEVAEERFILMLEDYWLCRETDVEGVQMAGNYMAQYQNVFRFDLAWNTLYINAGANFNYGLNTYAPVGRWDLIRAPQEAGYNFSFWGSIFDRDITRRYVIPGEAAQDIEIDGTRRVSKDMDEKTGLMVLGTRQGLMIHANIYSGAYKADTGGTGPVYARNSWAVNPADLAEMRAKGLWDK